MRTKNSQPVKRSRPLTAQAQSPGSGQHPAPFALPLQRVLPRASVEKADKVFKNFNLSKFPKDALPSNYVDRRKARDAAAVQTRHRELITQQLENVPETDTQNPGMMLAFPSGKLEEVQKFLPGIGNDGGSIQLHDLLKYLEGKMDGTVSYSSSIWPLLSLYFPIGDQEDSPARRHQRPRASWRSHSPAPLGY